MVEFKRLMRHLLSPPWLVRRAFPAHTMEVIRRAIAENEAHHQGEIRFAVEAALDPAALWRGQSARERAIDAFSHLRVWDTERNNGVLIYLLLADHDVEIVADRAIHQKVGAESWEEICQMMEAAFRAGRFEEGVLDGIRAVGKHLVRHYPSQGEKGNELPDVPVIL
jgi:uncharacterized membrane protein